MKNRSKRLFHSWLGRFLLNRTFLHATSNQEWEDAIKMVPNWKGVVIGNVGQQRQGMLPTVDLHKTPASVFRILVIARIHPVKGLELLIEALSGLSMPWQLTIAGDGEPDYTETLKKLAASKGLTEQIHWLGWVDGDAKNKLLLQSDLLVLPSQHENFANVVLEALALGTPVLISDQVGLKDYVLENDLGWVCSLRSSLQDDKGVLQDDDCHPVVNPLGIRDALETAWSDTAKRERIRTEAPGIVRRDFDPKVLVEQYRKAYEQL